MADTKNLAEAKKLMLEVYNLATEEPYSFLFINLMKGDVNEMFYKRFDAKLVINNVIINNNINQIKLGLQQ